MRAAYTRAPRFASCLIACLKAVVVNSPKFFQSMALGRRQVLALAAATGAVREHLWFGKLLIGGFTLHPLVLLFAVSGSLMISRIRIPKL